MRCEARENPFLLLLNFEALQSKRNIFSSSSFSSSSSSSSLLHRRVRLLSPFSFFFFNFSIHKAFKRDEIWVLTQPKGWQPSSCNYTNWTLRLLVALLLRCDVVRWCGVERENKIKDDANIANLYRSRDRFFLCLIIVSLFFIFFVCVIGRLYKCLELLYGERNL